MSNIAKVVSLIALGLVIVPSLLLFVGIVGLNTVKLVALVGTIGWFASTPMWMSRELLVDASEVEV
ncbi:hypothetical protein [Rhodopirellula sp. MGV]|uniref:hypothetical protein n=1 Tax=Rhodopirellula sp. MGV TaxID=2023130 RepID=UPI000B96060B|nr:hypothetical protein [Rhodopirellula sp. MGV]OYP37227.1 hypothetical protein CGZ80_05930 [Rhodopirellula sp. MGV]PNY34145.1 hypothetical protein C2E31_24935 [Rhodopirellula baltica]